jgi:hypothetical protein
MSTSNSQTIPSFITSVQRLVVLLSRYWHIVHETFLFRSTFFPHSFSPSIYTLLSAKPKNHRNIDNRYQAEKYWQSIPGWEILTIDIRLRNIDNRYQAEKYWQSISGWEILTIDIRLRNIDNRYQAEKYWQSISGWEILTIDIRLRNIDNRYQAEKESEELGTEGNTEIFGTRRGYTWMKFYSLAATPACFVPVSCVYNEV